MAYRSSIMQDMAIFAMQNQAHYADYEDDGMESFMRAI